MCAEKKKKGIIAKVSISLAAIVVIGGLTAWLIITGKLGLINRISNENRIDPSQETFEPGENNGGESINSNEVDLNDDEVKSFTAEDVKNILFIGTDGRYTGTENTRSDAMIICSVNTKTKEIKLISFMRDTYVAIPGFSKNRLNSAHAFGGMSLLDETIEKNFGVHIDGNVAVNFESFVTALSSVGNLDIELSAEEADYLNTNPDYSCFNWKLTEGVNSLDPDQVLAYARNRSVGHGDFERTIRQRKVIIAAFKKAKNLPLNKLFSLADKVLPCLATDMSNGEIISYITKVGTGGYTISDSMRIPIDGAWKYAMIDDTMSVILPDLRKNSEAIKEFIYGQTAESDVQQ